jgi:hypothetical protein
MPLGPDGAQHLPVRDERALRRVVAVETGLLDEIGEDPVRRVCPQDRLALDEHPRGCPRVGLDELPDQRHQPW